MVQRVFKGRLPQRDKHRRPEVLREHDQRRADGDVFRWQVGLHRRDGLLGHDAARDAVEQLVGDPEARARRRRERAHLAGRDGSQSTATDHERRVLAEAADEEAADDGREGGGDHGGEVVHAAHQRRHVLDGLEPHRQVRDDHIQPTVRHEARGRGAADGGIAQQAQRQHAGFAHVPFPAQEEHQGHAGAPEEADDGGRAPGVGHAAPVEREEQHDYRAGEEAAAGEVEAPDLLRDGGDVLETHPGVGDADQPQREDGDGTAGEVDIEAWVEFRFGPLLAWGGV